MNIGVDIRCLMNPQRTGVAEYTYELLSAIFKIDKENQFFLFYNSYQDVSERVEVWNQENVHYVSSSWPNKLFNTAQVFIGWPKIDIIAKNLDVFFSPNLNFTSISSATNHILTIHDLSFEILPECYSVRRRIWHKIVNPKKQCERADLILVPSQNTKRDVVGIYNVDAEKVEVLPPGLSRITSHVSNKKSELEKKYDLPKKFILYLGTVEPRKNIRGVVEAFKTARHNVHDPYVLVIAGAKGWKCDQTMKLIEKTSWIRYIGYVDAADKATLYQLADLFVYPSLYEGFGFPVLEAMSCGTPVITSNRSSLPEVSGGAAYLVNPYSISELSKAIQLLLKDDRLSDILIKKAQKRAREFNWQHSANEFLNLINQKI